jgi:uncharacterized integral membrane protein
MSSTPPLDEPARRSPRSARVKPDRSFEAKTLAALLLAGVLIAFAVTNSQKVHVDFLVTSSRIPLVIVILIAVLLGAILGALTQWRSHRRVRR